jgi:uncharacterized protein YoxC
MRRKELILDFTSLLDVIMIILFIVVGKIGQANLSAQNEAEAKIGEVEQELSGLQSEYDDMLSENEMLLELLEEFKQENIDLKASDNINSISLEELFESMMRKTTQVSLVCESHSDDNKTVNNEVVITIYMGQGDERQQANIVTFVHDFDLSKTARDKKNKEMKTDLYNSLYTLLSNDDSEIVMFTIEYTYGDINLSQTDLNNIKGAIDDIEGNLSKICYIDKMKK